MTRLIPAAGGLVFTETEEGKLRVLVAHRPRYDDWSLPKGKADPGETPEETALREVLEETGYRCRIVAPLGVTRYPVSQGEKLVTWFAMRPLPDGPGFAPNGEVDEIRWLSPKEAVALLDYDHDRNLVETADLHRLAGTGTIRLLRHVDAGSRSKWGGPDRKRPISAKGRRQAEAVAEALSRAGVERIYSSPYQRCLQSVQPLSELVGVSVEPTPALAEGADPEAAYRLVEELAGRNTVLCSHGDVIPALVRRLQRDGLGLEGPIVCPKGSIWEVEVEGGKLTTARYQAPPPV